MVCQVLLFLQGRNVRRLSVTCFSVSFRCDLSSRAPPTRKAWDVETEYCVPQVGPVEDPHAWWSYPHKGVYTDGNHVPPVWGLYGWRVTTVLKRKKHAHSQAACRSWEKSQRTNLFHNRRIWCSYYCTYVVWCVADSIMFSRFVVMQRKTRDMLRTSTSHGGLFRGWSNIALPSKA